MDKNIDHIGKYELRSVLARTPTSTVYDGWDSAIARRIAVKLIPASAIDNAEAREAYARFKRGAQAAGQLNHPNIVSVYDYGETADYAYLVMEFIDGPSLKNKFDNNQRYAKTEICNIIGFVLDALHYCHSRGVIHRDIKPANIMFTRDDRLKITDFGIARLENSDMTQSGMVIGTPAYMSPEQFLGEKIDLRTDIYSTGVVLYQMVTGERPYEGNLATIMHNTLYGTPARVALPALNDVLTRAMAKKREDRFRSAAEFNAALQRIGRSDAEASVAPSTRNEIRAIMSQSPSALKRLFGRKALDSPRSISPPVRKEPRFDTRVINRTETGNVTGNLALSKADATDDTRSNKRRVGSRRSAPSWRMVDPPAESLPSQGAGPHVSIGPRVLIQQVPPDEFDAEQNDVRRIREQLPLVREVVEDLARRILPSDNAFAELARDIARYRTAISGAESTIAWGTVWGLGVKLEESAAATERPIDRLAPALEDAAQSALQAWRSLHAPLILATAEGRELQEQADRLRMTRSQQSALREDAMTVAAALRSADDVIEPEAAQVVVNAVETIGEGLHPERGSTFGIATIKNTTIVLIGASVVAAPVAVIGGLPGAGATMAAWEIAKQTPFYAAAVRSLGGEMNRLLELGGMEGQDALRRLAPFRTFVRNNEASLRRIASSTRQLRWLSEYIDYIVQTDSDTGGGASWAVGNEK